MRKFATFNIDFARGTHSVSQVLAHTVGFWLGFSAGFFVTRVFPLQADLEGQLMAFEEKWTILNEWNGGRVQTLREVVAAWTRLEAERCDLERWMAATEEELKKMERSPTEEVKELTGQVHRIGVRRRLP